MKERIIGQVSRVNGPVIEADGITRRPDAGAGPGGRIPPGRRGPQAFRATGPSSRSTRTRRAWRPGTISTARACPCPWSWAPASSAPSTTESSAPWRPCRNLTGHFIESGITRGFPGQEEDLALRARLARRATGSAGGMILGTVQETSRVEHRILVPPDVSGVLESIAAEGDYRVDETIAAVAHRKRRPRRCP